MDKFLIKRKDLQRNDIYRSWAKIVSLSGYCRLMLIPMTAGSLWISKYNGVWFRLMFVEAIDGILDFFKLFEMLFITRFKLNLSKPRFSMKLGGISIESSYRIVWFLPGFKLNHSIPWSIPQLNSSLVSLPDSLKKKSSDSKNFASKSKLDRQKVFALLISLTTDHKGSLGIGKN